MHARVYLCLLALVELGIADPAEDRWEDKLAQRYLMSPSTQYYIPPGNIYRFISSVAWMYPCTAL